MIAERATLDTDDGPRLDEYRRLFTEAQDMTATSREMSRVARRYYDYAGLSETERRKLRRNKVPDYAINRVRPGIEGMVGVVEKAKADPHAYPRTPKDEDSAEVATDSLRYIFDQNRWSMGKLDGFRNMLIESTAAYITEVDDQLEVKIRRIRAEEYFYDPYARELDLSDKSYDGIAKWRYVDAIAADFPDHAEALRESCNRGSVVDRTFEDRPDNVTSTTWTDRTRKRMLQVEMYRLYGGEWKKCIFVGDLKLEEGPSPYVDENGKPINPIEARSAYVDDENRRYGAVQDMMGPQDEINVYRRKAAQRAIYKQVQETDAVAAYADPEEVRREAAKPDGVIPSGYNIVPDDKFQMDVALLQEAKQEIERAGLNPALLARGNATSGRQDLIRQQAGLTEYAHLYAGLSDLENRIACQAWNRVRQFWKEPKFIRVTDDENAYRFIQVNKPIWGPPAPVMDPYGMPQYDPITRQIVMQPQFLGMENAVAEMGVDIIVDFVPDTANVQQEQFDGIVSLIPAMVQAGMKPPIKGLIRNSSLPHKRELLEEIEQANAPAPPPQLPPEAQQALQLEMADKASVIDKNHASAEQSRANALKTTMEARMAPLEKAAAMISGQEPSRTSVVGRQGFGGQ